MMDKTEIVRRICELDPAARVEYLAGFQQRDLQHHLALLTRAAERSERRNANSQPSGAGEGRGYLVAA